MPQQMNLLDLDHQDTSPDEITGYLRSFAQQNGLNPDHMVKMAHTESAFNPNAVSTKGAVGVMQLMPDTAKQYGVEDSTNWRQNIEGGVKYFKDLLGRFNGDYTKATAAYNFGPERVAANKPWPKETQNYIAKITGQAPQVQPNPNSVPTGKMNVAELDEPTVPTDYSHTQTAAVPNFWRSLMASIGGPPTQYAFDPEYRNTINQNIPGIAAGIAASEIPGAQAFAPEALAGSPLITNLLERLAVPAMRMGAAGAGWAAGKLGQYGAEGHLPTKEEFARIGPEATKQGIIQGLFELPGAMFGGAEPAAYNAYRGFLKPSVADEAKGVAETGLKEGIYLNKSAADNARKKITALNTEADKLYADNLGSTHSKSDLRRSFIDWMNRDPGALESDKDAAMKVWKDAMGSDLYAATTNKGATAIGRPSEIDLGIGRRLKANLTKRVDFGEIGTPEREARKALAHIIGESEGNIDPAFTVINQHRKELIDFEEAAEKFVNRQYKGPVSERMAYPLARAGIGGAMGFGAFHDPYTALGIAGGAATLANPRVLSNITQFIAKHPEVIKQLGARGMGKSFEGQPIPQNLEDLKVNLSQSPFTQELLNRGQQ
jgi:hypothetical protein